MIIQVHTPSGIIDLDTELNSDVDFAEYNLDKSEYTKPTVEERLTILETEIRELKNREI